MAVKLLFSKKVFCEGIITVENNTRVNGKKEVVEIFSNLFSNAVKNDRIEKVNSITDPIMKITTFPKESLLLAHIISVYSLLRHYCFHPPILITVYVKNRYQDHIWYDESDKQLGQSLTHSS